MTKTTAIPTVKIILYRQKKYSNGEHPLMLQSIQNRKVKRISLGLTCSSDLWDFKNNEPKRKHPDKLRLQSIISAKIEEYRSTIIELIEEGKDFTPQTLVQKIEVPIKRATVFDYFSYVIKRLNDSKLIGNAQVYQDTFNSFKAYKGNRDLTFSDLTVSELMNYESFLRGRNLKDTTLSVRFRTIRALFRSAISEGVAKEYHYPFNTYKISSKRFNLETKRTAITKDEIVKIRDFDANGNTFHQLAQHFFMFSYYGAGINFVDFCKLKPENRINERIFYKRSKTRKEVDFILLEPAQLIANHWSEQSLNTGYLFPILDRNKHITETQINNRINKVNAQVNTALKEIALLCGITVKLTSGVARHTFATALKREGVNTAIIQEAMRHKTQAITQTYLASFGDEVKDEAMKKLL